MPRPRQRAGEQPALLILPLTNGHLMVTRVNRSDTRTLATLNQWYPRFFEALALLQKGTVDYIAGSWCCGFAPGLGRTLAGTPAAFLSFSEGDGSSSRQREHNISRLFWHSLAVEQEPKKANLRVNQPSQPG